MKDLNDVLKHVAWEFYLLILSDLPLKTLCNVKPVACAGDVCVFPSIVLLKLSFLYWVKTLYYSGRMNWFLLIYYIHI